MNVLSIYLFFLSGVKSSLCSQLYCRNSFRMTKHNMMLENKLIEDDCHLKCKQYLIRCVFFANGGPSFDLETEGTQFPQPFLLIKGNTLLVFTAKRQHERYFLYVQVDDCVWNEFLGYIYWFRPKTYLFCQRSVRVFERRHLSSSRLCIFVIINYI